MAKIQRLIRITETDLEGTSEFFILQKIVGPNRKSDQ